jgi:hypothetical protein
MPGLGKTQLALKYASSAFETKRYRYVFWMSASSTEKINHGFSKILDLISYPNRDRLDQAAKLTAARLWLESVSFENDRKWVLVLDNTAEDVIMTLRDVLPKMKCNGHILFTTRTKAVAQSLAVASGVQYDILALKQPSTDDATTLFLKSTGKQSREDLSLFEYATNIVKSVGCLPLAIDQASSFMNESGFSAPELLDVYRSDQVEKGSDFIIMGL